MTDQKRPYRKKRRAEMEAETRERLTKSAVALHGTLGPSRTSMSAVAEHAGVRRSTLYRHFPDEEALFDACSTHWAERNPPPDLERWAEVADPDQRLREGLEELYGFYRRSEGMLANLLRDEATMPVVERRFRVFHQYLAFARETLLRGRGLRGKARDRVRAAIGHGLAFATWRSLTEEQGLEDAGAAELVARMVAAAA
jgi:AcrR family transcriptional regulator